MTVVVALENKQHKSHGYAWATCLCAAALKLRVPLGSKLVGSRRQTSKSSKVCRGTLLRLQSCEILKTHKKVKTLLQLSPSSKCSKVSRHVRPIRAHTCCKMARRARPKQNFFKILKRPQNAVRTQIVKFLKNRGSRPA